MSEPDNQIEVAKIQLEMWRKSIEVTQHFNELSHKTRQSGLTGVGGGLALAFALATQYPGAKLSAIYSGFQYEVHIAGFILLMAAIGVHATRLLDIRLHHRMLRGSVAFTQDLETSHVLRSVMGTNRGLAQSISFHSRSKTIISDTDDTPPARKTSAEAKLRSFYNWTELAVILASLLTLYGTFVITPHDTVRINQTIEMPRR